MIGGLVLILGGLGTWGIRRVLSGLHTDGITRTISKEFEPVSRINVEPGVLSDFNVLIITTDTTRADHIGCYGNRSINTPNIDQLAKEGILCGQAITPSPSTMPAHSSLMTGLYPYKHGVRANGTFNLEPENLTLAEMLKEQGYRTAGLISAFVLDSQFGIDQGFDYFNDDLTKGMKLATHMFRERPAELTNEPAIEWLRENGNEKFFMWVHYFDPHAAYLPPDPWRQIYADDLYDGEIAYADSQIGVLLKELESLGVRKNTLIIYTSDHGEGLGEHGEQTHSLLIYDATLHVPLVFSAPSHLPSGKILDRQTGLIDVVPTVLSLLGMEVPDEIHGQDLCEHPSREPRPMIIETVATMTLHGWAPLIGVRREDYKHIHAPIPELYDLKKDPRELKNVIDDEDEEILAALKKELFPVLGEDELLAKGIQVELEGIDVDEEVLENLARLGYVASTGHETVSDLDVGELRDPKEMIHQWETLQHGINLRAQGKVRDALPIIKGCVADVAGDIFARNVLSSIYMQMGEYEKAIDLQMDTVKLEPNAEHVWLGIAAANIAMGKIDEAKEAILKAEEVARKSAQPLLMRGRLALRMGDRELARKFYEKAIEEDPGTAGPPAYCSIGHLELPARRLDEAREAFNNALKIDPLNGIAHDGLANVLYIEENFDEAEKRLRLALKFDPNQPRALATLALIMDEKGEADVAMQLCKKALEISPKYPMAHNNIGLLYRKSNQLELAEEHYKLAVEYAPYLGMAHINLAQLYLRQEKSDEAMDEFRKALKANPRSRIALANLAAFNFNNKRVKKAYQLYRRALMVDPDYALVHQQIADIYAIWDKPHQAAHHIRESLRIAPNQPDAPRLRYILPQIEKAAATRPAPTHMMDEVNQDDDNGEMGEGDSGYNESTRLETTPQTSDSVQP